MYNLKTDKNLDEIFLFLLQEIYTINRKDSQYRILIDLLQRTGNSISILKRPHNWRPHVTEEYLLKKINSLLNEIEKVLVYEKLKKS